ncbi:glycosyltransferase family 15 protein [Zalerion maritima]|uniref:Glycosyltransferase family 15 protein n=1 Tax=Zalerion maritima TaxID=339359 RepID=A0AAD5WS44_9PEZI|nr:glycosyltransferase family 15 protein [Zalerion maritima]
MQFTRPPREREPDPSQVPLPGTPPIPLPGAFSYRLPVLAIDLAPEPSLASNQDTPVQAGRRRRSSSLLACIGIVALSAIAYMSSSMNRASDALIESPQLLQQYPLLPSMEDDNANPARWIQHVTMRTNKGEELAAELVDEATRPKAAIITLVTEDDLPSIIQTVSSVEEQFNSKHLYDWVFFSPSKLDEGFRQSVSNSTSATCLFEEIDSKWVVPKNLDASRVGRVFDAFDKSGMSREWIMNTHHAVRWKAGLFAQEKRLDNYDWFWMIEPGTTFDGLISYDVFRFLRDNNMAFGTDAEKVYSLYANKAMWHRVRTFVNNRPGLIHPQSPIHYLLRVIETGHDELDVLTDDGYDNFDKCQAGHDKRVFPARGSVHLAADVIPDPECHDCPSFMMGSVDAFRSKPFYRFFRHLDNSGLFYYHTVNDDLVHRLAMTMFAHPHKSWFFDNIGASNGICTVCPTVELRSDVSTEDEVPFDQDMDPEESEYIRNESLNVLQLQPMWANLDSSLSAGLEVSKLESGQTYNFFRVAEQEGIRIDIREEEEPVLSLPDSDMEREIDFIPDPWTEQFIRSLQGGH